MMISQHIIPVRYYVVERGGEYLTREDAEWAFQHWGYSAKPGSMLVLGQKLSGITENGRPRRTADSHGEYPVHIPVRPGEGARVQEVGVNKVDACLEDLAVEILSRRNWSAHSAQQWGYWPVVRRAAVKASYILAGVTFGFYLAMVIISR